MYSMREDSVIYVLPDDPHMGTKDSETLDNNGGKAIPHIVGKEPSTLITSLPLVDASSNMVRQKLIDT